MLIAGMRRAWPDTINKAQLLHILKAQKRLRTNQSALSRAQGNAIIEAIADDRHWLLIRQRQRALGQGEGWGSFSTRARLPNMFRSIPVPGSFSLGGALPGGKYALVFLFAHRETIVQQEWNPVQRQRDVPDRAIISTGY